MSIQVVDCFYDRNIGNGLSLMHHSLMIAHLNLPICSLGIIKMCSLADGLTSLNAMNFESYVEIVE